MHREGRAAQAILNEARRTIASLVQTHTDDVIFTSGATEANTLALEGHIRALINKGRAPSSLHLLYLPTAHRSLTETAHALERIGVSVESLPLSPQGRVDLDALVRLLREETVLVAMDAVCGETGIIWNTRGVRTVLEKRAGGGPRALLHVDASQAPLSMRFTRSHWGADTLTLDAQKVGGIRGIGALIVPRTVAISPLFHGGGQERGIRPGTEAVALAAAFAAALAKVATGRASFHARATKMREELITNLANIPACVVTRGERNAPSILSLSLRGRDTDYLTALLDEKGFAVSTQSACETNAQGSRTIFALTKDAKRAASPLRISWGPQTRRTDLKRFARALRRAVAFLDENPI